MSPLRISTAEWSKTNACPARSAVVGARLSRPEVARPGLNRQRRLSRHLHGDRMPAAYRHALRRVSQHVTLAELVENLREGSNGRIAKARPMRIAAGARGALAKIGR